MRGSAPLASGAGHAARRAFVLGLLLTLAACGRKLPPQAPLQVVPARVDPLGVTQEGSDVVLRFPFPSRTVTGETLTQLTGVTVLRELLPAPAGATPPEPPSGDGRERAERDFRARAQPLARLGRSALDEATVGGEVVLRDSLYPLVREGQLGRVFLRYGVLATRERKRSSPLSPLVTIHPRIPPAEPLRLSALVEENRVCVAWLPPRAMLDDRKEVTVGAYAVYRRLEADEAYEQPIGVVNLGREWIDDGVEPGRRYVYTVRAAPTAQTPLVLGPPADELLVDTRDAFPPPAPEGFLVLSEERDNRLVWNPVLAPDLVGYRIYRRAPGEAWKQISETSAPTFGDVSPPANSEYAVSAYDRAGNESLRVTVKKEEGGEPGP